MGIKRTAAEWRKYRKDRIREIRSKWYGKIRDSIFARDEYTCAITGKTGGALNMHHIYRYVDYPELRLDRRNLITLSKEAHDMITGQEDLYAEFLWSIADKREWLAENKDGEPKDTKPRKRRSDTKASTAKPKRPRKKRGDRS